MRCYTQFVIVPAYISNNPNDSALPTFMFLLDILKHNWNEMPSKNCPMGYVVGLSRHVPLDNLKHNWHEMPGKNCPVGHVVGFE